MRNIYKMRVKKATVGIVGVEGQVDGQGVLVPGPFILTATHCIKWSGTGEMALGDYFIETIRTIDGKQLRLQVLFADLVSDMAVLGAPDCQEFYRDCEAFEKWSEVTKCVPLMTRTLRYNSALPVEILSHEGDWINGNVHRYGMEMLGTMCLEANQQIRGGTSGGPVVDLDGRLLGVVSNFHEGLDDNGKCIGMLPIAHLTLPAWVLRRGRTVGA